MWSPRAACLCVGLVVLAPCARAAAATADETAVREIVARYWDAYNAGDVDRCLACRAVDAPENDEVRAGLTEMFATHPEPLFPDRPDLAGVWISELVIDRVETAADTAVIRMTAVLPIRDTWPTEKLKQERIIRLVRVGDEWKIRRVVDPTTDLGDELLTLDDVEVRRQRLRSARKLVSPALVHALLSRQWDALRRGDRATANTILLVVAEVVGALNDSMVSACFLVAGGIQAVHADNPVVALAALNTALQVFEAAKKDSEAAWHAVAYIYRGRAYLALADDAKAVADFEVAEKLYKKMAYQVRRCDRPPGVGEYFLRRLDDRVQWEAQAAKHVSGNDFVAAIRTWREILALDLELFGPVHDDVAGSCMRVAKLSVETGDWSEATAAAERRRSILKCLHGDQHWWTADARELLGWVQRLASASDEERQHYRAAERNQKQANELRKAGKFREAEAFRRTTAEAYLELFGPSNVRYAEALVRWGYELDKLDEDAEAEQRFLEAARIYAAAYPRDHNFRIWCHEETAEFYERQIDIMLRDRNYSSLVATAEKWVAARRAARGEEHYKTWNAQRQLEHYRRRAALSTDQLAKFHRTLDDHLAVQAMKNRPGDSTRLELAERVYREFEAILGAEDWYCLLALQTVTYCEGDLSSKLERTTRLERWWFDRGAARVSHLEWAHAKKLQSAYLMLLNRDREAEDGLREAESIFGESLGQDSEEFLTTTELLATVNSKSGDYKSSGELLARYVYPVRMRHVFGEELLGSGSTFLRLKPRDGQYTPAQTKLAELYRQLAANYEQYSLYTDARKLYEESLAVVISEEGENSHEHVKVLVSLARCRRQEDGQLKVAEAELHRALEIEQQLPLAINSQQVSIHYHLGHVFYEQDRYVESIQSFEQSIAEITRLRGADHSDIASALRVMVRPLQAAGRTKAALNAALQSLDMNRRILQQALTYASESAMRAYVNTNGGEIEILMSLLASTSTEDVPTEAVLGWVLRWKGLLLDVMCQMRGLEHAQAQNSQIRQDVERLNAFRRRISDLTLVPFDPADAAIRTRRLQDLRATLGQAEGMLHRNLVSTRAEPITTDPVDVAALRARIPAGTVLVEYIRSRLYRFRREPTEKAWAPAHYYAFIITPDASKPVRFVDLGEAEPIDQAIGDLREHVEQTRELLSSSSEADLETEYRELAGDVHRRIVQPLEDALADATTVIVSPDGELNRVAFETLVDEQGRYLVERRAHAYVSSGRDLLRRREPPGTGTLVFAGPDFDLSNAARTKEIAAVEAREAPQVAVLSGALSRSARGGSWTRLRGAEAEAKDVTAALGDSQFGPVVSYIGAQALEDVFKRQRAPRVLHIATHGYFFDEDVPEKDGAAGSADRGLSGSSAGYARLREAENPLLRSGIVLAGANRIAESTAARESSTTTAKDAPLDDGWLTAEEISTLDLRGTDLVVLSACETGLGDVKDREGVQGLRRAFLHAGAATIITSLYEVPDDATQGLMQGFYRALRDGQPKLQALHAAQTTALKSRRDSGGAAHPYFWGSFILVGQPN